MQEYSFQLSEKLRCKKHEVFLINSKNDIEKGDVLFLLSCFQLVKRDVLALNKHNIVVHASHLPSGKGWSPLTWQILEGENRIHLTLFEAVEDMDAGNIYLNGAIVLDGTELLSEARYKLANEIQNMCLDYIENNYGTEGIHQEGESTFYRRRTPEDSELDINKTIDEQFNLLRIVDNERYPAFFVKNGVKYILTIRKAKENE
jgi:methionyl-tRNA formyltransferase